jgi:hypothetical protein
LRVSVAARAILAVMILFALLSTTFAFALAASTPPCALACCAGRPAHAADSCMSGACHAVINPARNKHHDNRSARPAESLCGLSPVVSRISLSKKLTPPARALVAQRETHRTEGTQVTKDVLGRPCPPECGGCVSSSTSSRRQRQSATAAAANRNPLILITARSEVTHALVFEQGELWQRRAPRGPPLSFS